MEDHDCVGRDNILVRPHLQHLSCLLEKPMEDSASMLITAS